MGVVFYSIPFFLLLIITEYLVGRYRKKNYYTLNDTITNLSIGIGNQAVGIFSGILMVWIYVTFQENFGIFSGFLQFTGVWYSDVLKFLLCLTVFDCFYYWAHRWSHEWNFLWAAHVVHHQSEEYNLSVALRQSWFHNLLAFFIFLPIPILGFQPIMFFAAGGIVTLFQFWIHTKAINRMPRWFEFIFNSPSHHRVHHAVDPKYIDKNHAAVFIIWDRIFGTYAEEEEEPTYGITKPLQSWNPTWANLHYFVEMFNLARHCRRLWDKIRTIWARPGWRPKELGGYIAPPPVDKENYQKFDTDVTAPLRLYAILQFFAVLFGLLAFMANFDRIHELYRWLFLGIIILSIMICGAILERKRWVAAAEYIRLALILLSLNTFYYIWFLDWFVIMVVSSFVLSTASALFFRWGYRQGVAI